MNLQVTKNDPAKPQEKIFNRKSGRWPRFSKISVIVVAGAIHNIKRRRLRRRLGKEPG